MAYANERGAGHVVKAFLKWFFIVLGTLLLVGMLTVGMVACYAASYIQDVILPQVESSNLDLVASDTDLSSSIYYYDEDTESYQTLQTLYATENRVWVSYEDIPEMLVNATVAIEDKRFWTHHGVDWVRTAAAVVYMFTGQDVQGGSTITQQLIKNLTQQDEVTVKRKVLEIFEALEFDSTHSKEETMEWYLNEIYLGHGCYGVVTAAEKYFGKELSELSLAECASLISITNNPSLYDPYTRPEKNHDRARIVISQMLDQEMISQEEANEALIELGFVTETDEEGNLVFLTEMDEDGTVTYVYDETLDQIEVALNSTSSSSTTTSSSDDTYSWYTDAVVEQVIADLEETYGYDNQTATNLLYSGGLQIYSCLDPDVQSAVDTIYGDESYFADYDSASGQELLSAITIVDNDTGAVVALAGGVGEKEGNRIWNCATDTKRPSGSSIKPLSVYAPALEEGLITPYSVVDDSPFKVDSNNKLWPSNSEGYYRGLTTVWDGMVESLNTLAVKVLDKEGIQTAYDYLTERFGITSLEEEDLDYAPLALGGQTRGVSTYEMAAAYATFPRGGSYTSPYLYTVVLDAQGNIILATDGYTADVDADGVVTVSGTASASAVLSESTCYYITEMLRAVIEDPDGTAYGVANISGVDVAGKTGTTTNDYDRWFCGYSSDYTAAVWSGYDTQEKISYSGNPSTEIWQEIMSLICEQETPEEMTYDVETVTAEYCTASGGIPTDACREAGCVATGTYVKGDEPTTACTVHTYLTICKSSGKIAGSNCKSTKKVVALDYTRTGAAAEANIKESLKTVEEYQAEGTCKGEKSSDSKKNTNNSNNSGQSDSTGSSESTDSSDSSDNSDTTQQSGSSGSTESSGGTDTGGGSTEGEASTNSGSGNSSETESQGSDSGGSDQGASSGGSTDSGGSEQTSAEATPEG
ncbi:MAG: transglycosylase domain-containing protein [Clostridiales bacterium]|nr:transglycosylase domain-containing protein [Clostridiales bacterium]